MIDKTPTDRQELKEVRRLLARTPVIVRACELDLLGFLHRHPRTLLTSEQIAVFVGHELKQVAKSIEAFIAFGLLERTQNSKHAARMYLLLLNGPQGEGLTALLKLAATRQGRRDILELLGPQKLRIANADAVHLKRRLK